jgi:hypothetical protein
MGVQAWCFCGEFVVGCVVNVVLLRALFRGGNIGQGWRIYFWVLAVAYEPNVKQQQIPAG